MENIKKEDSKIENLEQIEEIDVEPTILSIEEKRKLLKGKLKQKIHGKRTNRTVGINRKKSENLNDSMSKITELLVNKGVDNPNQIDSTLLENVMDILNKQDIELLANKLKDNTVFKEIISQLEDKYNE